MIILQQIDTIYTIEDFLDVVFDLCLIWRAHKAGNRNKGPRAKSLLHFWCVRRLHARCLWRSFGKVYLSDTVLTQTKQSITFSHHFIK